MSEDYKFGKKLGEKMVQKFNKDDHLGVIKVFNKSLKIEPNLPNEVYLIPGLSFTFLEDYENAIQALRKVIATDINNEAALAALGRCYLEKDTPDPDAALIVLGKAQKLNPNECEVYWKLGLASSMKKDWKSAVNYMEQYLELDKQTEAVWVNLVDYLIKNNEVEKAIRKSKELLELFKENTEVWVLFLTYFLRQKKYNFMLYCYEKLKDSKFANAVKKFESLVQGLLERGVKPVSFF